MELSRKLFSEIVGVDPESIAIFEPAGERRKHVRVAFGSRARIFPLIENPGQSGCPVLVRDISRSGVGFLFDEPMALGDEFVIHLPRQASEAIQIHALVQRCVPGGSGGTQWAIGATFELVLNLTEPLELPGDEVPEEKPIDEPVAVAKDENAQSSIENLFDLIMKGPPAPVVVLDTRTRRLGNWLCTWKVIGGPAAAASRVVHCAGYVVSPVIRLGACVAKALHLDKIMSARIRHRLRPARPGKRRREEASKLVRATIPLPAAVAPAPTHSVLPPASQFIRGTSKLFAPEPAIATEAASPVESAAVPVKPAPARSEIAAALPMLVQKAVETALGSVAEEGIESVEAMPVPAPVQHPHVNAAEAHPVDVPHVEQAAKVEEYVLEQATGSIAVARIEPTEIPGSFLMTPPRPPVRGNGERHPRRQRKGYFRFSTGTKSVIVGPV